MNPNSSFSVGVTIGVAPYQFVRIDLSCPHPEYTHEQQREWCIAEINKEIDNVRQYAGKTGHTVNFPVVE